MSGTLIANLPAATTVLANDLMIVEEVGSPNVTKRATAAQVLANALPLTGGVINGTVEIATGSLLLDNAVPINAKDNGGTSRGLLTVGTDNNVDLFNAGGARARVLNQSGTTELIGTDNLGNVGVLASLSVAGVPVVRNDFGTYSISITGTSGGVAWGNIGGKPYAFNQSTDVGSSPTFNNMAANTYYLNTIGGTAFFGNSSDPVLQLITGVYFSHNGGNPVLNLNPNNFVEYNGNLAFNTTGSFTFSGGAIQASGSTSGGNSTAWFGGAGPNAGPWTSPIGIQAIWGVEGIGFFTSSDGRLKTDVQPITPELAFDWIDRGNPVTYKIRGQPGAGFIAQDEIRNGRGVAVRYRKNDDPLFADNEGLAPDGHELSRDYNHDIAYLTAAIKALREEIKELKK